MSVSVDTVYQRVLGILNKEQRGYVTPQEFNLFANQAQMDLFEQYFYDINQFGRIPGNDTEYSDMLDVLNKKIASFETKADLLRNLTDTRFVLPGDMYRLGTVIYKYDTIKDLYPSPTQPANYPVANPTIYRQSTTHLVEAERINQNEFLYINASPLTKPKNSRPLYTSDTTGLEVFGTEEIKSNVKATYIKKPAKVEWKYQMVYGEALYDATYSVDFELHPSEETELVIKVLELAGLLVKDLSIYQVFNSEEQEQIQQEKS
tara:strand:+ start:975 stop:1760 length:786 start_codon:yes stop_codon:yes gene_type:complete